VTFNWYYQVHTPKYIVHISTRFIVVARILCRNWVHRK